MTELVTKKPCIDICEFNKRSVCKACGRTREEKKQWKQLTAEEKQRIWNRVLVSHGSGRSKEARALQALYQKASGKVARRKNDRASDA